MKIIKCKKCSEEFNIYQEIEGKIYRLKSRIYCLKCKPFKSDKRREIVCECCNNKFKTTLKNNDGTYKNFSNRKYCLDCSPFNGKGKLLWKETETKKWCPCCKNMLDKNKFLKKNNNTLSSYCKECTSNVNIKRYEDKKKTCVDYLGGKCIFCDYNKSISALDFHHINPEEKDIDIARYFNKSTNIFKTIKLELDKCMCVCSNCHREIHSNTIKVIQEYLDKNNKIKNQNSDRFINKIKEF